MKRYRQIDAEIVFLEDRDGQRRERGRERASYRFNADGSVTFTANSESDRPAVTRDAIYTLNAAYHPLECFVRMQVEGRYEGSGWYRFGQDFVEADIFNHASGRTSQRLRIEGQVAAFNTHPVSTDVLLTAAYRHDAVTRRQRSVNVFSSSADPYGRVGPTLHPVTVELEYCGRGELTTPVGRFDTDRYLLYVPESGSEPLEEMWSLAGTPVFVQARAKGVYETIYQLTRFEAVAA